MSLKKLEISRLMDAYTDETYEPKEEAFVNQERIKEAVLGTVKKKRYTVRKVVVLAAALAACLALVGFTWGEQIIQLMSGGQVIIGQTGIGGGYGTVTMSDGYDEQGNPTVIALEEGRLWFVADGQRLDVTDQVDDETPYVHTAVDEQCNLHYWIVGGTPEDYGWFEGVTLPDGSGGGGGVPHSRTDLTQAEKLEEPEWYLTGKEQVEDLWRAEVWQDR